MTSFPESVGSLSLPLDPGEAPSVGFQSAVAETALAAYSLNENAPADLTAGVSISATNMHGNQSPLPASPSAGSAHSDRIYWCPMCHMGGIPLSFGKKADFETHLKRFHCTNAIWRCRQPNCHLIFESHMVYKSHLLQIHKRPKVTGGDLHAARIDLSPQLVFGCGFPTCKEKVYEATTDEDAVISAREFCSHVANHFKAQRHQVNVTQWDFSIVVRNLMHQSKLEKLWKSDTPAQVRKNFYWDPVTATLFKKVLEHRSWSSEIAVVGHACELGALPRTTARSVPRQLADGLYAPQQPPPLLPPPSHSPRRAAATGVPSSSLPQPPPTPSPPVHNPQRSRSNAPVTTRSAGTTTRRRTESQHHAQQSSAKVPDSYSLINRAAFWNPPSAPPQMNPPPLVAQHPRGPQPIHPGQVQTNTPISANSYHAGPVYPTQQSMTSADVPFAQPTNNIFAIPVQPARTLRSNAPSTNSLRSSRASHENLRSSPSRPPSRPNHRPLSYLPDADALPMLSAMSSKQSLSRQSSTRNLSVGSQSMIDQEEFYNDINFLDDADDLYELNEPYRR
jgi:hypothetical protein